MIDPVLLMWLIGLKVFLPTVTSVRLVFSQHLLQYYPLRINLPYKLACSIFLSEHICCTNQLDITYLLSAFYGRIHKQITVYVNVVIYLPIGLPYY
jgi:hypothetical protein